mmetsp:Transcript_122892/g.344007  ORF Transcript_122892/g.344007 Transcript_122892/m.344007 type:complete len:288 (+) Transcript_122892:811-1674(+)
MQARVVEGHAAAPRPHVHGRLQVRHLHPPVGAGHRLQHGGHPLVLHRHPLAFILRSPAVLPEAQAAPRGLRLLLGRWRTGRPPRGLGIHGHFHLDTVAVADEVQEHLEGQLPLALRVVAVDEEVHLPVRQAVAQRGVRVPQLGRRDVAAAVLVQRLEVASDRAEGDLLGGVAGHQLHELVIVHLAAGADARLPEHLLHLLRGDPLPERAHAEPEVLDGERPRAVHVEEVEGLPPRLRAAVAHDAHPGRGGLADHPRGPPPRRGRRVLADHPRGPPCPCHGRGHRADH